MPKGILGFPRPLGITPLKTKLKKKFDVREYIEKLSEQHGVSEPEVELEITPQPRLVRPDNVIVLQMVPAIVGEEYGGKWKTYTKWHAAHEFYHYFQIETGTMPEDREEAEEEAVNFAYQEVPTFHHDKFPPGDLGALVGEVSRIMFGDLDPSEALEETWELSESKVREVVKNHPEIFKN